MSTEQQKAKLNAFFRYPHILLLTHLKSWVFCKFLSICRISKEYTQSLLFSFIFRFYSLKSQPFHRLFPLHRFLQLHRGKAGSLLFSSLFWTQLGRWSFILGWLNSRLMQLQRLRPILSIVISASSNTLLPLLNNLQMMLESSVESYATAATA